MIRVHPHLAFNGTCEEAFGFYEKCLGGKVVAKMTFGESPMAAQFPADQKDKIIHLSFAIGDQIIAGADAPQGRWQKPQGFTVTLDIDDAAEADRVFATLSDKAEQVHMPIQETFWAKRFGMLTDRFGTPWMINCSKA
jgi:PhnB protein